MPVIAAIVPSLVLNELAVVQPLDRRTGAVFYMDVLAGTSKGNITANDTLISAKTGHARTFGARRYGSTIVQEEAISGSTVKTTGQSISTTVTFKPGINLTDAGTIVIREVSTGYIVGQDTTTAGTIAAVTTSGASCTVAGSLNAAGTLSLTVTGTTDTSGLSVEYRYNYDQPVDAYGNKIGVPELDVTITSDTVTAIDFLIRSKFSVGAAVDAQKAHAINLEETLTKFMGNETKFTIDQFGLDEMDAMSVSSTAATRATDWNAKVGDGQQWEWKISEILDRFEQGSNNIVEKTLRASGTFVVAGNNVARVIKQLAMKGMFKPVSGLGKTPITGPTKIGTLSNGLIVVQHPFMQDRVISGSSVLGTNRYFMGYKAQDFTHAGFILAPYIPLFATPTLMTSDLYAQKGFYSSAGFKRINPGMYCFGTVSNLGETAVA